MFPFAPRSASDRINVDDPNSALFWAGTWGLTDQELRDAVAAVGPVAGDVAAYLGQPLTGANNIHVTLADIRAQRGADHTRQSPVAPPRA